MSQLFHYRVTTIRPGYYFTTGNQNVCDVNFMSTPLQSRQISYRACDEYAALAFLQEYRDTISEMHRRVAGTVVVGGFDVLSIQRSVVLRVEMGLSTDSDLIIYVAIPQYQF